MKFITGLKAIKRTFKVGDAKIGKWVKEKAPIYFDGYAYRLEVSEMWEWLKKKDPWYVKISPPANPKKS